jgi:putative thioredoxin
MPTDVTDQTFEEEVLKASADHPVVVDLWAPWCGPCRTLGPIIEKVIEETDGVELVKVNVDENPQISAAFQVQSIPAVYALSEGKVVDGFIGALPEAQVREFIGRLAPQGAPSEIDELIAQGDEESLRHALEHEPDNVAAISALAELLVGSGRASEAEDLLARIPETAETRRIAAMARLAREGQGIPSADDIETRLNALLDRVKSDDEARQEYVDLLEAMDPEDPRRATFRKALSSRLF